MFIIRDVQIWIHISVDQWIPQKEIEQRFGSGTKWVLRDSFDAFGPSVFRVYRWRCRWSWRGSLPSGKFPFARSLSEHSQCCKWVNNHPFFFFPWFSLEKHTCSTLLKCTLRLGDMIPLKSTAMHVARKYTWEKYCISLKTYYKNMRFFLSEAQSSGGVVFPESISP